MQLGLLGGLEQTQKVKLQYLSTAAPTFLYLLSVQVSPHGVHSSLPVIGKTSQQSEYSKLLR